MKVSMTDRKPFYRLRMKQLQTWRRCEILGLYPTNLKHTEFPPK